MSTTGRVQSLLVLLSEVSQAEHLIKKVKSLRQSNDLTVRSSVFINADLTKAEALTVYHRRCRHRELAAARSSTQPSQPCRVTDVSEDTFSRSITVINSHLSRAGHSAVATASSFSSSTSSTGNHRSTADVKQLSVVRHIKVTKFYVQFLSFSCFGIFRNSVQCSMSTVVPIHV